MTVHDGHVHAVGIGESLLRQVSAFANVRRHVLRRANSPTARTSASFRDSVQPAPNASDRRHLRRRFSSSSTRQGVLLSLKTMGPLPGGGKPQVPCRPRHIGERKARTEHMWKISSRRFAFSVHGLFFLSGTTGLICELVWTRWLTRVLGSASSATAIVLAVFMGGLGLGSWLAARFADRQRRPIRCYGFMELGVATTVLLPLWGVHGLESLFATLASWWGPVSPALHVVRILAVIAAIGPSTVLMGASLPLIVRALASSNAVLGRHTASAYAINSFGGVVGTLLAGFVLISNLGVRGTALTAAGMATAVGLVALLLDRLTRFGHTHVADQTTPVVAKGVPSQGRPSRPHSTTPSPANPGWILAAAAATGFCGLAYEIIWTRVLSVITLNTTYAFSLMLAVLLAGLSVGSWLVRARLDRLRQPMVWFVFVQTALAAYALSSSWWAPSLRSLASGWVPVAEGSTFAAWFGRPLLMGSCLLFVPAVLMGASLPIVCRLYSTATGRIGGAVGRVYAANTLGSVAGSLVVGLMIIPQWGTSTAAVICVVLGAGAAATMSWLFLARNHRAISLSAAIATALLAVALNVVREDTFATLQGLASHEKLIFRAEDEYGLVEVAEDQQLGTRWMLTNRLHWEGSTLPRAVAEQRKQGILPLVLHPSPRRVLEIGLGTGIKLSGLDLPLVEEAVAVEISPGVIEASRSFADYNHDLASSDSKVEIVCADGRNFVALTPRTFDVIVNGLLTPYRAGVSRLYTTEHFRNCREKLADDGMFVVWIAIRQIAPDDLKVVTRTLLDVFPHTTMWLDGYYLAFVSTKQPPEWNVDDIERRCEQGPLAQALDEADMGSPRAILATFVAGPDTLARFAGDQPRNTEDRPIVEFRTPRLGDRLNTSDLAAEMIGTLSLLQEPLWGKSRTAAPMDGPSTDTASRITAVSAEREAGPSSHTAPARDAIESVFRQAADRASLLRAQQARWTSRQALIQKCYGNHLQAAQLFRDALAIDETDDLARYELEMYLIAHGQQSVDRGLLKHARRTFQEAVRVNPRSIGALASLATLEEAIGNRSTAQQLWRRAASLDPGNRRFRRQAVRNLSASGSILR